MMRKWLVLMCWSDKNRIEKTKKKLVEYFFARLKWSILGDLWNNSSASVTWNCALILMNISRTNFHEMATFNHEFPFFRQFGVYFFFWEWKKKSVKLQLKPILMNEKIKAHCTEKSHISLSQKTNVHDVTC